MINNTSTRQSYMFLFTFLLKAILHDMHVLNYMLLKSINYINWFYLYQIDFQLPLKWGHLHPRKTMIFLKTEDKPHPLGWSDAWRPWNQRSNTSCNNSNYINSSIIITFYLKKSATKLFSKKMLHLFFWNNCIFFD